MELFCIAIRASKGSVQIGLPHEIGVLLYEQYPSSLFHNRRSFFLAEFPVKRNQLR